MVNREHKLLNGEETEVVLKGKSVTEVVLKGSVIEVVLKGKSMAEVVLKGKRNAFAKAGQVANWGWRRHLQRRVGVGEGILLIFLFLQRVLRSR